MRYLYVVVILFSSFCISRAQENNKNSSDCVINTVRNYLIEEKFSISQSAELWNDFYVVDMADYKMFDPRSTHGVYAFGVWGDDVWSYYLIHDGNTCTLLPTAVTYSSMRLLLDFLSKYNYSAEEKINYIEQYMVKSNIDYQQQAFKCNAKLRELFKDIYTFDF